MKVRKECTLYNENLEYVKKIKEDRNVSSFSAALDIIISEHKKNNGEQINALADIVVARITEKYENLFTRMRLGVNTADRNSQVMLEILNSLIWHLEAENFYPTDKMEAEIVKESIEHVKKKIEYYKQLKDNKKY